ncbi:Uu.00g058000.m01.CDS01 [Anthostomella pinea]|uniref:Uu.00g058000.m01.CDS01 n=1 Tax=Anthostomella pinea TaxID=933095 RepID=A0AAI8VRU5_9PEZI|nr:Uu.00g058000.m01.CDS01 [Anthostomella pinea]
MSFDQPMPPFNAGDPSATFVGTSCLDLLLIELVPMAYRIANELDAAAADSAPHPDVSSEAASRTGSSVDAAGGGSSSVAGGGDTSSTAGTGTGTGMGTGPATSSRSRLDEDEERDAVFFRLETLGYRVGLGLVERFSRDRPRFNDTLDAIKFVCKDLWMLVFKKQVDNLKTNHRGVYVLTDNSFRPLSRMSTDAGGQAVARAQPFLWFPCGILKGALSAMGINATVQAESSELPGAVFQIKTIPTKQ